MLIVLPQSWRNKRVNNNPRNTVLPPPFLVEGIIILTFTVNHFFAFLNDFTRSISDTILFFLLHLF